MAGNFKEILVYLRAAPLPRRVWVGMTVFTVLFALTEGAGVGMLMPVLIYVEGGRDALTSGGGSILITPLENAGIPINLATLLVVAVVPFLLRQLFYFGQALFAASAQYGAESALRVRLLKSFINAPLSFHLASSSGALVSGIMQEAGRASTVVWATAHIMTSVLMLLVYAAILAVISPTLTFIALPLLAIAGLTMKRLIGRSREIGAKATAHTSLLGRLLGDSLSGIRLIKMRGAERQTVERLTAEVSGLRENLMQARAIQAAVEAATQPIVIIGAFGIFYVAIEHLGLSLSALGIYLFVLLRSVPTLTVINTRRLQIGSTLDGARGLHTIGGIVGEAEASEGAADFPGLHHEVRFEDVNFAHERDGEKIAVLHGLNLTIRRGETVALVGPSGGGKSTTVDLLARFFAPDGGRITIDGQPIQSYAPASLRRSIGLVGQETVMFNDTLRNNLGFGLDRIPADDTIWAALAQAHCKDFVSTLPAGLDTVIGERGLQVSGGQRQRLALARALLCNPDILVLDEPTSALDSVSEAQINASLAELRGKITMLIIAHRLATVQHADRIIVLDNGHAVDEGTHTELLQRDGLYRDLCRLQKLD